MTQSDTPPSHDVARHRVLHISHPDAHAPGYEYPEAASMPAKGFHLLIGFILSIGLAWVGYFFEHINHAVPDAKIALPWVLPFILLLACIATMPFIAKHFWEHNYHRVSMGLGLLVAAWYYFMVENGAGNIGRALSEYISFIFLLGSLFIVSGGILIRVRARATPLANAILLLIGAVIANIFGTTGASMLLIRPYLRMNKEHLKTFHVVFFIFIVANAGGSLTPIGDPPLFLGFLQGVPFYWVFEHCWPIWLLVNGLLVVIFLVMDILAARKDDRAKYDGEDIGPKISLYGGANILFISIILAGILLHNQMNDWSKANLHFEAPWREMLMGIGAFGSLAMTPKRVHGENVFNYGPIKEVAYLFIGIFITMVPALNYLYNNATSLPLRTPGQYYFSSGSLSSVLDNAPTYLTFLKTELGSLDPVTVERVSDIVRRPGHSTTLDDYKGLNETQMAQLDNTIRALVYYHADRVDDGSLSPEETRVGFLIGDPNLNLYLIGISMGAVLFGAMTYIGNGPNFMVKSIADNTGAPTPSFFAYIFKFSLPILLPILLIAWLMFLW